MNDNIPAILLPGIAVVTAGALVLWGIARQYRRALGLKQEEQEKTQDVSFIINAFQDVTRQLKEKEKELERLRSLAEQRAENVESYTENILHCVTSGVVTFDRNGLATTMNRAAEEILAVESGSCRGRSCSEIFGEGEICRLVLETLETNVPSRRVEAELVRRNERIWLGFNTAVLTAREGKSLGVILSFSDLTEVKRLQEQIELKERLTALGEMSAGIAHELRNPMAVIAGYLNLLAKKQDPAGQTVIRDIQAEIKGMNRIISDLLTFARPTSLNRSPIDMKELLESCVETVLQSRNEGHSITTELDIADAAGTVDEVLMRQALANLVQNAVEAMPEGGTLSVALTVNRNMKIVIKDTGRGIPPEHIKKIFLPFFTTKDRGVGMGLALTHKVITAHGGRIDVESGRTGGTTFTVLLPGK
ncbi:MAG: two-component system sensor histidine kinase NtrB [Nitrospirota bacterium]